MKDTTGRRRDDKAVLVLPHRSINPDDVPFEGERCAGVTTFLDGKWTDITRLVGLNERAVFAENAPYALVAKEHKTFRAIRVP